MLPGEYLVRSLEHPERTTVVELVGRPDGRLRREAIMAFIAAFWTDHGYAPTVREVGIGVGLHSSESIHRQLHLLTAAGRIGCTPSIPRSIRVVEQ